MLAGTGRIGHFVFWRTLDALQVAFVPLVRCVDGAFVAAVFAVAMTNHVTGGDALADVSGPLGVLASGAWQATAMGKGAMSAMPTILFARELPCFIGRV